MYLHAFVICRCKYHVIRVCIFLPLPYINVLFGFACTHFCANTCADKYLPISINCPMLVDLYTCFIHRYWLFLQTWTFDKTTYIESHRFFHWHVTQPHGLAMVLANLKSVLEGRPRKKSLKGCAPSPT